MMTRRQFTQSLAITTGVLSSTGWTIAAGSNGFAFTFEGFDGKPLPLDQYAGRAVLVVNTASECGFTGQYAGLEAIWQQYQARGLTVVGVPSNDFGGQEPLKGEEIANFCQLNYGVTFPLADRTVVTGEVAHPFYRWAREAGGSAAVPRWNFHKILLTPDGQIASTFPSGVRPQSAELVSAIEKALPGS